MLKLEWLREFIRSDFYYEDVDFEEKNIASKANEKEVVDYKLAATN
jgi:hypothetical protein